MHDVKESLHKVPIKQSAGAIHLFEVPFFSQFLTEQKDETSRHGCKYAEFIQSLSKMLN